MADALFKAAEKQCDAAGSPCPDFAFINAGAIRHESGCGHREFIYQGSIFENDITSLLPFFDPIVVVRLSGRDVLLALEHSVSHLLNQANQNSASFLHVSGLKFSVDCSKQAQVLSSSLNKFERNGRRVGDITLDKNGLVETLNPNKYYEVATTKYIAEGNNGFISFLQRSNGALIYGTDGTAISQYNFREDVVRHDNGVAYQVSDAMIDLIKSLHQKHEELTSLPTNRIFLTRSCH